MPAPVVTAEQLARLSEPGPRDTSYPTANAFDAGFGPAGTPRPSTGWGGAAARWRCTSTCRSAARSAITAPAT